MLNKHNLEKILIKNWTDLFDIRDVLKYIKEISNTYLPSNKTDKQINNLSFSRFELTNQGFLIWINYNIIENKNKYKAISEIFMDFSGNFSHVNTTLDI